MNSASQTEPWLRGELRELNPIIAAPLFALQHAREDIDKWTAHLTDSQIWARPFNLGPVGFHIRHIGGATHRLVMYLQGKLPSPEDLADFAHESDPGKTRTELITQMEQRFAAAEVIIRAVDPKTLAEPRAVGRKQLPTTVGGLLVHIAEHTQRHLGEIIVTAKVLMSSE